jgi:hypothetical protein
MKFLLPALLTLSLVLPAAAFADEVVIHEDHPIHHHVIHHRHVVHHVVHRHVVRHRIVHHDE